MEGVVVEHLAHLTQVADLDAERRRADAERLLDAQGRQVACTPPHTPHARELMSMASRGSRPWRMIS